jgi:cell division topological specificity factor
MNLLGFLKSCNSAPVARERLQILLAHERTAIGGQPDLITVLREEILAVIAKHTGSKRDNVQIRLERGASLAVLELTLELPVSVSPKLALV